VDGGGLDDLLGLCVMGRDAETGRWLAWARAWAHPSVLERHKQLAPRFRDFARDGDLVLVQQIGEDVEELQRNKWRYCVHKDELVVGIGRPWCARVSLDQPFLFLPDFFLFLLAGTSRPS
jgi:phage terminase large subunit-like protein